LNVKFLKNLNRKSAVPPSEQIASFLNLAWGDLPQADAMDQNVCIEETQCHRLRSCTSSRVSRSVGSNDVTCYRLTSADTDVSISAAFTRARR
jgi:hypothetical protein